MDYRYLTETKNEFNNFLCSILVPHLYHGIKGMLKYSESVYNQIELKNKSGAKINNPGIINIFKKTLIGLSSLNNHEIEEEYLRIKNMSGCVEWFDNLVLATFKSHVLFLTWDPKICNSKYSDNSIYNSIIIKDFIHKCYIISCNYFKDNPEIFIQKNQKKEIFDILKTCIEISIKKSLPYNQIIQEYLEIEFEKANEINSKEIQNIKSMVYNIINDKKYGPRPNIENLMIETINDEFVNLEDSEFKRIQLENFINQEKINQTNKLNQINKKNSDKNSEKSFKSYKSSKSYTNKNGFQESENKSSGSINELSGGHSDTSSIHKSNTTDKNENQTTQHETTQHETTKNETTQQETTQNETTSQNNETSVHNKDTSGDVSGITKSYVETSAILSRAEIKNKEIDKIMDKKTDYESLSKKSKNIKTISDKNSSLEKDLYNFSKTSDTTNIQSIENILTSPPIIKIKPADKLNDLLDSGLNNLEINKLKFKNNIKITKEKNNKLSDKFDVAESFYDNLLKN